MPRNGRVEERAKRLPAVCDVEHQEPLGRAGRAHTLDVSLEHRNRVVAIGGSPVEEAGRHESGWPEGRLRGRGAQRDVAAAPSHRALAPGTPRPGYWAAFVWAVTPGG